MSGVKQRLEDIDGASSGGDSPVVTAFRYSIAYSAIKDVPGLKVTLGREIAIEFEPQR
jgi:hypothetical protein